MNLPQGTLPYRNALESKPLDLEVFETLESKP